VARVATKAQKVQTVFLQRLLPLAVDRVAALTRTGRLAVQAVARELKQQRERLRAARQVQQQHLHKVFTVETVLVAPRSNIVTAVAVAVAAFKEQTEWSMSVSLLKLSQVRAVRARLQASRVVRSLALLAVVAQQTAAVRHRARQGSGERAAEEMARSGHLAQTAQLTRVQVVVRRDTQPHSELVEMVVLGLWFCDIPTPTTLWQQLAQGSPIPTQTRVDTTYTNSQLEVTR
jgi:hypothetical protein